MVDVRYSFIKTNDKPIFEEKTAFNQRVLSVLYSKDRKCDHFRLDHREIGREEKGLEKSVKFLESSLYLSGSHKNRGISNAALKKITKCVLQTKLSLQLLFFTVKGSLLTLLDIKLYRTSNHEES